VTKTIATPMSNRCTAPLTQPPIDARAHHARQTHTGTARPCYLAKTIGHARSKTLAAVSLCPTPVPPSSYLYTHIHTGPQFRMPAKTYYAIHGDGIYTNWFDEVQSRTKGKNVAFKAFGSRADAETFMSFERASDAVKFGLTYSQRTQDAARRRGRRSPNRLKSGPWPARFSTNKATTRRGGVLLIHLHRNLLVCRYRRNKNHLRHSTYPT
jgi:hypothetical protein